MHSESPLRQRLAVIGDPISHSLSPVLQNSLIGHFDLPFHYEAVRVAPSALPAFIQKMRAGEFAGVNVTIPHKQAIIPLLDDLATTALQIGAANTIVNEAGWLLGHNTDAPGFLRALQAAEIDLENQDLLLLGAGGAAKAVLHVALAAGASTIYICNRDNARAEALRRPLTSDQQDKLRVIKWKDRESWLRMQPVTVIANATSAGMPPQQHLSPLPATALHGGLTVIDLIYNPGETLLLRETKKRGGKTLNGLSMLIYQGVAALELWSRKRLEIGGIYPELEQQLLAKIGNP